MPRTPDDYTGEGTLDELRLFPTASLGEPDEPGEVLYLSGTGFFFAEESGTLKTLTSGAINPYIHSQLRQLIHFMADAGPGDGFSPSPFQETVGVPFVNRITWYTDSSKQYRIYQHEVTRSGIFPITESYKLYNNDGSTLAITATDAITYQGAFETARSRSFQ